MDLDQSQIEELNGVTSDLKILSEGGYTYIYLSKVKLPGNCVPLEVDCLLCPMEKDGYKSSLFFSTKIECGKDLNWNRTNVRIVDKTWHAISWQTFEEHRLIGMIQVHLNAFRL